MDRFILILSAIALTGCGDSNNDDIAPPATTPGTTTATFEVTVTNLTNAQPLSPIAFVAHDGDYRVFALGSAASAGLEVMAEGGDNVDLLTEADALGGVFLTRSGTGPIGPGASETVSLTFNETTRASLALSVASMLVNTNDAFSAVNTLSLAELTAGASISRRTIAYDAGTEADTEGPGTIPGPAVGGEGFNVARDDDADRVSMHPGVISVDDGLSTSILGQQHRFDNPVMGVVVTRVN